MRPFAILLACFLAFACARQPDPAPAGTSKEAPQKDDAYKKEIEEIRKDLKGDIRIKLKKDGKGDYYSWEISGKDPAEVLKANDTLARKLGK